MSKILDKNGNPLELVLYKFNSCPFCVHVMNYAEQAGIPLEMKDTIRDRQASDELYRVGGKTQVPCLFINGRPLYESQDIIGFLRTVQVSND